MRAGPRRPAQRGAILVKFALLSFAFFAVAALVIDMRIASWTQQQMQVATDSATLEGLRWRDQLGPTDARGLAAFRVSQSFDDDLDPSNGDSVDYGAGPNTFVRDTTVEGALGVIELPDDRVYDPELELNLGNLKHGDMVSGEYLEADQDHDEAPDYDRTDFVPTDPATSEAFLVRLRRSSNFFGLDDQPGVSSSGASIPFLWGRGSLINDRQSSTVHYDPRLHGITVRATAIAASRRALEIATPGPDFDMADGTPFPALQRFGIRSNPDAEPIAFGQVIRFFTPGLGGTLPPGQGGTPPGQLKPEASLGTGPPGFWENLIVGNTVALTVRADGTVRFADFTIDPPDANAGSYRGGLWGFFAQVPSSAGDLPVRIVGHDTFLRLPTEIPEGLAFVPLFREIDDGSGNLVERAIGFGRVSIGNVTLETPDPNDDPLDQVVATFEMTKLGGAIVPAGVTAVSAQALAYLSANGNLQDAHADFEEPVLAPVLTR